jgi:hypothetical protein
MLSYYYSFHASLLAMGTVSVEYAEFLQFAGGANSTMHCSILSFIVRHIASRLHHKDDNKTLIVSHRIMEDVLQNNGLKYANLLKDIAVSSTLIIVMQTGSIVVIQDGWRLTSEIVVKGKFHQWHCRQEELTMARSFIASVAKINLPYIEFNSLDDNFFVDCGNAAIEEAARMSSLLVLEAILNHASSETSVESLCTTRHTWSSQQYALNKFSVIWLLCQYYMANICQLAALRNELPPEAQINEILGIQEWSHKMFFHLFETLGVQSALSGSLVKDLSEVSSYSYCGYTMGITSGNRLKLIRKTDVSLYSGAIISKQSKVYDTVPYLPFEKLFRQARFTAVVIAERAYIIGNMLRFIKDKKTSPFVLTAIGIAPCGKRYFHVVNIFTQATDVLTAYQIALYECSVCNVVDFEQHFQHTHAIWKETGLYWKRVRTNSTVLYTRYTIYLFVCLECMYAYYAR